jgi:purine-binding chemotaxis protein CheW
MEGLEWLENGRPQWAQSRFDVLLFKVSGLTLAVPLISLGQIQPLTDELTPLFGQADWFMGLQPTPAGKIRTVNTAKFVMPERYDPRFLETAKYVMSINGVPWGLAVDSVNQPITLMPDDVKWRSDRSKRPWLAGTVKDHMCALLDIPRIGQMLVDADKNFVPA